MCRSEDISNNNWIGYDSRQQLPTAPIRILWTRTSFAFDWGVSLTLDLMKFCRSQSRSPELAGQRHPGRRNSGLQQRWWWSMGGTVRGSRGAAAVGRPGGGGGADARLRRSGRARWGASAGEGLCLLHTCRLENHQYPYHCRPESAPAPSSTWVDGVLAMNPLTELIFFRDRLRIIFINFEEAPRKSY